MKKFLAAIALFFSLFFSFHPAAASAETIDFCRPNNMVSSLAYIAEAKGFFQQEGVNVKFTDAPNAKICLDMLVSGNVSFTTGAEAPPATVIAQNQEAPVKIIALLDINPEMSVFARKDSGIASPADLKGKKIGYTPSTTSFFYLNAFLKKHNLTMADIKPVALQIPAMPKALIGGQIDAMSNWQPWGYQATSELGQNAVVFNEPDAYAFHSLLSANPDFLARNPEDAQKILKALIHAGKFINKNREESIQILSKALNYPKPALEENWTKYTPGVRLNAGTADLMTENFKALQESTPEFKDKPLPDYARFIDNTLLEKILNESPSETKP